VEGNCSSSILVGTSVGRQMALYKVGIWGSETILIEDGELQIPYRDCAVGKLCRVGVLRLMCTDREAHLASRSHTCPSLLAREAAIATAEKIATKIS
jgi:hypothetical protein